jgi:AcrR family transcriptional regulator
MSIEERKNRERSMRGQQIQVAAKELFIEKGFNSTTIEDIAKKAELSPATIYLYFKNKEELYTSLNLITLQYLSNKIKKIYDNGKLPIEKKIFKFKDALYTTFAYDPLMFRNILHVQLEDTLLTISSEMVDKINNMAHEIMKMIAGVYEEGVRQNKFNKSNSTAQADIIWGLFTGIILWEESKKKLNPKKDFVKSTLDIAFDIFCRGIKKSKD